MDKKEKQQELQRILIEAENYKRQAENIGREMQIILNSKNELNSAKDVLSSMKEKKSGIDMLVPVGFGLFVKAKLTNTENILLGIGADVSVEKTVDEAIEFLNKRDKEIEDAVNRFQQIAAQINNKLLELDSRSRRLMGELQGEDNP